MKDLKNYCDILGVDPGIPFEEIKRGFRDMAKVWDDLDRFLNNPRLQAKAQNRFKEHPRS